MKRLYRVLSAILCLALLLSSMATTIFAVAPISAVPNAPEELDNVSEYLHASSSTVDNVSKLPVNIHTYYDSAKTYTPGKIGVDGSVSILYVMNTNTERLGKKTDSELIRSFLERGYFVIVLDYQNNSAACGTELDWSVQDIRCQVINTGKYTDGKMTGGDPICARSYILPAGYDIEYNIPYFSYDKHGVAGSFEYIVEVWNTDFKSVKRDTIVKWVNTDGSPKLDKTDAITEKAPQDTKNIDYGTWFRTASGSGAITEAQLKALSPEQQKLYQYTYIGNTKATDVTDCVQPDGSMIDLNLYFDILYPSDYEEALPVMISMSSNYTRTASWTTDTRPHLNGFLFGGYVGVVSDYGLVPMCRNDHYGYFCGDSQLNSVSGDNVTYSMSYYNGIHSDTALLRTIRRIGVEGMNIEGHGEVNVPMDPERIGAYGNSKAGVIVRLANPTPERLEELRHFEGHMGESRLEAYEGAYPYEDPYILDGATTDDRISMPESQPVLNYSSGETIHSGLNLVFANCGGASNTLIEGSAPIYGVGTQVGDANCSYYTYYATTANLARNLNIPFFGLVAPTLGHEQGYGMDADYGIDVYEAFLRYSDYWLKNEGVECIIVDVDKTSDICVAADVEIDNIYEIGSDSSIKLQFTGTVDPDEIEKVRIVSLTDGSELSGSWCGSYGNQQWSFIPYDIKDATYYTVVIPGDLAGANGKAIKEGRNYTFRTANGVTEEAVSVTSPPMLVATYDCVNRGFTLGAAGYTLDQSTYKFNAFKGADGLQLDLRAISESSGINTNQNVRLPVFDEIWADSSYIGKTITFSFEAKASEAGWIKLALNQHGNGNYVWGNGWGVISDKTDLTTEWQTFTYQFTVTEDLFNAKNNSTSSTPNIALGVRFSGFLNDSGKYKSAQLNFRNFNVYAPAEGGSSLTNINSPLYFTFAEKDYSASQNITLRFAVVNDAVNTVGVYQVNGSTLGEKLGEILVTGSGIYNFDVTNYIKSCKGKPAVAVKFENAVGVSVINNFTYEGTTTGIHFNGITKSIVTDEIPNTDGTSNNSAKLEYLVRSAYYIDLDGNLVCKSVSSLANFASSSNGLGAGFTGADYGKRFRISFRIYDETSRIVNVRNGYGYSFDTYDADFRGTDYSFSTVAGEWMEVSVEFTLDDEMYLGDVLKKHIFLIDAENKGIAVLDEDCAVNTLKLAGATVKPGNYAGQAGLNSSYTKYTNAEAAAEDGKVTFYDELSYGLYLDDIRFERVNTAVELASTSPMLSITPTVATDILPTVSASVLSALPDAAQDGLYISGGMDGFDKASVKTYVKLSLDDYYGGYAAFLFNAKGERDANVFVYGVSDVSSGSSWEKGTITSQNAPANNIYGSGVNLNAVYNNAAIASFKVGTTETSCLVDISEFAKAMQDKGAKEITLVLVSDTKSKTGIEIQAGSVVTKVDEFDCINRGPATTAAGYTLDQSTYKFYSWIKGTDGGLQIDTRAISGVVNANQNGRISIFDSIFSDRGNIGKTIRFSFRARASEAGRIGLTLNQRVKYAFTNFPGFSATADLTTSWETFTFEFVATQDMFDAIIDAGGNTEDATRIQQALALGVRFSDFSDGSRYYDPANGLNGAQIVLRDFVISTVEESETEARFTEVFDFDDNRPTFDTRGYGKQLATILNGELQIDLTKDSQAPNANAYTRVEALNSLFADSNNAGKTFIISFRAKASEAGLLDLAFNKFGSFNTYEYSGKKYSTQFNLSTEYQTYTYIFTAIDDMFTTNETSALQLAFRLYNGYVENGAYKAAQVYIDDLKVIEDPYVRSVDITYDMSSNKPTFDTRGYGKQLATIVDGELQIDLTKDSQSPNANAYTRVEALNEMFANSANAGKTFTITFRAKASEAGIMDFAFNKAGSFNTYAYGGTTYKTQYSLTTEYQTYSYTFVALEDMFTTNASSAIQLAFRLYNGYAVNGAYKAAQVYIDDIRLYEEMNVKTTTLEVGDTVAVSAAGNSDDLSVYADDSATGAPEIYKTYLSYNLTYFSSSYAAYLKLYLSGAVGETVKIYAMSDVSLPSPLTYSNAPVPSGASVASFVAKDGENSIDISSVICENVGKNIVLVITIEVPSERIEITGAPAITITNDAHSFRGEEHKHTAIAPDYNTPGNVEFYSCFGCEKLYIRNGEEYVETSVEDIILPTLPYETCISGASLNLGTDLSVRYHILLTEGEDIEDFKAIFYMNDDMVEVSEYSIDERTGKPVFSFSAIAPQCMGDSIRAELYKGETLIDCKESYSVREYVEATLELYPDYSELRMLLFDLLAYGAAAQEYVGYKTDELVTDGIDMSGASINIPTDEDNKKNASDNDTQTYFTAAGVRFDYINRVYVKIKVSDIDGVNVSVAGKKLELISTGVPGEYIAYSDAISALDFADTLEFTLAVYGETVQTLTYSVNDYAYSMYGDADIGELALALYRYGKSAVVYKNSL